MSSHVDFVLPNNTQWPHNDASVMILRGHDDPLVLPGLASAIKTQMTAAGVDWQYMQMFWREALRSGESGQ